MSFPLCPTSQWFNLSTALIRGSQSSHIHVTSESWVFRTKIWWSSMLMWDLIPVISLFFSLFNLQMRLQWNYDAPDCSRCPLDPCEEAFRLHHALGTAGIHNVNPPSAYTLKMPPPICLSEWEMLNVIWACDSVFWSATALPLAGTSYTVTGLLPCQGHRSKP